MKKQQIVRENNPYFNEAFELRFITNLDESIKCQLWNFLKNEGVNKGDNLDNYHLETAEEAGDTNRFFVYLHYDPKKKITLDGKEYLCIYVGITRQDSPESRWNDGKGYNGNKKFALANEKYKNWADWEVHCIIAEGLSEKAALALESFFIELFDSFHHGLNGNEGGAGRPKGVKFTEEEKENLRKSHVKSGKQGIIVSFPDRTYVEVTSQVEAAIIGKTAQPNVSDYCNGKKEQRKNSKPHFYWKEDFINLVKGGDGFVF